MSGFSQKLEALLFVSGEPLSLKKLTSALLSDEARVRKGLEELETALSERGLRLVRKNEEYLLVTAPELGGFVERFMKEKIGEDLSRAMLETLAVVVYQGPLPRSKVDYIRGVNSSFTLRNLMIRGLVERVPHQKDSRVWLYRPSFEFLKFMGIDKIEKLPDYEEFKKETERLFSIRNGEDSGEDKKFRQEGENEK